MDPASGFERFDRLANLGPLGPTVARRLERMQENQVLARIHAGDHTVWKDDPTEITNRLGWLTLPADMAPEIADLTAFAQEVAEAGFRRAVLLGMGGSSLAPEMYARTYGTRPGLLLLTVLDTTHPATIRRVEESLDLPRTLFIVASKSGTTLETLSHFEHFFAWADTALADPGGNFVAITDPGTPLDALAKDRGFRRVFRNPPDLGGRYSALSLFGLVPGALIGMDLAALVASAAKAMTDDRASAWLGAVMGEGALAGRDKLTFVLPPSIAAFGDWVEQLVAESTGKEGTGIVPVPGEDLGPPDVYGEDRLFVALGDNPALGPLREAGHPVVTLPAPGQQDLGAQIFRFEMATAVAGYVLGINAFDQPNVEEAKQATRDILAGGPLESPDPGDAGALLAGSQPGDYVAIQAYIDRSDATAATLQADRLAIRDRLQVATTLGFGPRFLHSTGQLHKGGPPSGIFLQITDGPAHGAGDADRDVDMDIPGQPFTFGRLIDAQALGDLKALRSRARRVARVSLKEMEDLARSNT